MGTFLRDGVRSSCKGNQVPSNNLFVQILALNG
jgi:hypothetical protein